MKKIMFFLIICLFCISFGKGKLKNTTGLAVKPGINITGDYRKDITPLGTEDISSNREKYFSTLEYSGKKWNTVFVEDLNVFKYLREKLSVYRDTAILFLPRGKRIVCVPKESNISEVFLEGENQIKTKKKIDSSKRLPLAMSLYASSEDGGCDWGIRRGYGYYGGCFVWGTIITGNNCERYFSPSSGYNPGFESICPGFGGAFAKDFNEKITLLK